MEERDRHECGVFLNSGTDTQPQDRCKDPGTFSADRPSQSASRREANRLGLPPSPAERTINAAAPGWTRPGPARVRGRARRRRSPGCRRSRRRGATTVTLHRSTTPRPVLRIDDVRVALAVDLDEPLGVARGRDGRVLAARGTARAASRAASSGATPIVQPSAPGGGPPTTMSPAPATRARVIPCRSQDRDRLVGGVALGDPADVELHAGLQELDGPRLGVEQHLSEPTSARALASSSGSGSFRSRRARRQSRTTGAIVDVERPAGRS